MEAYRRAIGSYEAKVAVEPLLSEAGDEPSTVEVIYADEDGASVERRSDLAADAGTVGRGEAAGPAIVSYL